MIMHVMFLLTHGGMGCRVVGRTRIGDEKCNVLGQQYLPGVVRALAGKGLLWAITMMLYMDGTFCRNVKTNGPFQLSTLCLKKSTSGIVGPVSGMMLGSHTFSFKRMEKIEAFKPACLLQIGGSAPSGS